MSSFLDGVVDALAGVAPTIAQTVAGPLGGAAVNMIETALGLNKGASATPAGQDAILKSIAGMDPQTAIALHTADLAFQQHLQDVQVSLAKNDADDRASARNMQVQTRDPTPRILAICVFGCFFGLLGLLSFVPIPVVNHDALMMGITTLGSGFIGIVGFYFGSSLGSQNKDAALAAAAKGNKP
jgi:hypothetical protein